MTCIIGAVCKDGVVLVGDRKVLRGEETLSQDKIIPVVAYANTVVASSGTTEIMDYFLNDINSLPKLQEEGVINEDSRRSFVGMVEDIVVELYNRYEPRFRAVGEFYNFDVLISYKPKNNQSPLLMRVFKTGVSRRVRTIEIIGSGEPNVLPFIKTKYHSRPNEITMNKIATTGVFAINLVDHKEINLSVGGSPQIWKLPNNKKAYEVKGKELDKIFLNAYKLLGKFEKFL